MGKHHDYGVRVLRQACSSFTDFGPELDIRSDGGRESLDGHIDGKIAVEIEAKNKTQIRGAVDKLLRHRYTRKLLVIMIPNLGCTTIDAIEAFASECRQRLEGQVGPEMCRVVVLAGHGDMEELADDVKFVRAEISDWIQIPHTQHLKSHP
jgi:hypothetical protein